MCPEGRVVVVYQGKRDEKRDERDRCYDKLYVIVSKLK